MKDRKEERRRERKGQTIMCGATEGQGETDWEKDLIPSNKNADLDAFSDLIKACDELNGYIPAI